MSTRYRILKRAAAYGVVPPGAAVLGMQFVENPAWDRPIIVGAAIWVVVAMALAVFAMTRVDRRSPGAYS